MASRRFALPLGAVAALLTASLGLPPILGVVGAPAATTAVYVFPIPGGRVALPSTQITFRGVNVARLGTIHVSGSQSGGHRGRLEGDSDGQGASFLPNSQFTPGETVTVSTSLNVAGAGKGTFQFTVAQPGSRTTFSQRVTAPRVRGDVERFRSRPDLAPAAVSIARSSTRTARGDLFLGPQAGPVQDGPMIRDWQGTLIWFKPLPPNQYGSDFRVQRYQGKPVLTWWQGYVNNGIGSGDDVINDTRYRTIARFTAGNGLQSDQHEFQLTSRSTALVTAYYPVYWDESPAGGPSRAAVIDSVVQEIDVPTGLVLFQWDSLDHISVGDSHQHRWHNVNRPWDYFHVNSIQQSRDGNLIVSGRNTWAAYKVDHHTGRVIWSLGGKHSSFKMGSGTQFAYQHDVRLHAHSLMTMFDDGAGPPQIESQSRVLGFRLDFRHRTASLAFQYGHTPGVSSFFEGNAQQLSNGDFFVGWGQQPYFSEYDSSGQMIFDGRFVADVFHYRTYRFRWNTTPDTLPRLAASTLGRTTTVHASWNGATSIAAYWRVLAGSSPTRLRTVTTVARASFETSIAIPSARYVAVQALDGRRHRLGRRSLPVRVY